MPNKSIPGEEFACAACGEEFGRESAVAECRMCHRSFCDGCIDDRKICVPCSEIES